MQSAPPSPAPLLDLEPELLEREPFLGELREYLRQAAELERGRLVLVAGEAGIGKTALVRRFCAEHGQAARVLVGACDSLPTPRALGPLVDVAEQTGGDLRVAVGAGARPYEAFTALVAELRREQPTILVLEDVHWADEATFDLLRIAGRRIESAPALVLVSYRDDELDWTHPLRVLLGELATSPMIRRVQVPPLSLDAVAQLAAPYGIDSAELYRRTGGNPFFVTEALGAGGGAIPATVRDAVLARAGRLAEGGRRLLDAVSIVPQQVELWLLEALAKGDLAHLDECLASGMVRYERGAVGFRHELGRQAIELAIPPLKAIELHRAAVRSLASPPGGTPDPARLAHHAEGSGDADAVLRFAPIAAERAAAVGAHREAADQYCRAMRFAEDFSPERRAELWEHCAYECYLTERLHESIDCLEGALALHRANGNRLREGDSLRSLSRLQWCIGKRADAERSGREAVAILEELPAGPELAMAYSNVSGLHMIGDENELALEWGQRAVELAKRIGNQAALSHALTNIGVAEVKLGSFESLAKVERALDVALEHGLDEHVVRAHSNLAATALDQRRYALAEEWLERAVQFIDDLEVYSWLAFLYAYRARAEFEQGRWGKACRAIEAVLAQTAPLGLARMTALVVQGRIRARRGDPGTWASLDEALDLAEPTGELQQVAFVAAGRAEAYLLEGRPQAVQEATEDAYALARKRSQPWYTGELAWLRRRALIEEPTPSRVPEPYRLLLAGEFTRAAEVWSELGCPYEAADALLEAGGDEALQRAVAEFRALGARPAAAEAARRLRELMARGPRPSTQENPAGLTARELEVLALVADGLRNADIAARLVVSQKTVDHHVSAILRKLGVRSRTEAGAVAARLGVLR